MLQKWLYDWVTWRRWHLIIEANASSNTFSVKIRKLKLTEVK